MTPLKARITVVPLIAVRFLRGALSRSAGADPREPDRRERQRAGRDDGVPHVRRAADQVPVEAFWCGELDAGGARPRDRSATRRRSSDGSRCASICRASAGSAASPTSCRSRRRWRGARTRPRSADARSTFFYVRRFASSRGGPDEYVAVTCRLTGGGARVPLSLTRCAARVRRATRRCCSSQPGRRPPAFAAEIAYNGTGRLAGGGRSCCPARSRRERATCSPKRRCRSRARPQRRYTELERFNVFLPPTGASPAGPRRARAADDGGRAYLVLLRIEASERRGADSNLGAVGAGSGVVHSGAVAGFPMPVCGTSSAPAPMPRSRRLTDARSR